jgi:hypothetical protein
MELPRHAGVANAIGAVVGRITIRKSGVVTSPSEGVYRVHLEGGPEDFRDEASALGRMEAMLTRQARDEAQAAGAQDLRVIATHDIKRAQAEARTVFIEGNVTVEASGRPRIAG